MLLLVPVYSWIPKNVYQHRVSTALYGEMQIRIHGTKNAYTTLRPYDCVLYLMDNVIDEKDRSLGVYTPTNEIVPLCNYEEHSIDFHIDKFRTPYSATKLNSEARILRVVSADRRGSDCFIVEEYLDTDVFIPLRDPNVNPPAAPQEGAAAISLNVPTSTTPAAAAVVAAAVESESMSSPSPPSSSSSFPSSLSTLELFHAIDIANAKLEASLLRIELAQLLAEKTRRSGDVTTTAKPILPTQPNVYSSASSLTSSSFVETPLTTTRVSQHTLLPFFQRSPYTCILCHTCPVLYFPFYTHLPLLIHSFDLLQTVAKCWFVSVDCRSY